MASLTRMPYRTGGRNTGTWVLRVSCPCQPHTSSVILPVPFFCSMNIFTSGRIKNQVIATGRSISTPMKSRIDLRGGIVPSVILPTKKPTVTVPSQTTLNPIARYRPQGFKDQNEKQISAPIVALAIQMPKSPKYIGKDPLSNALIAGPYRRYIQKVRRLVMPKTPYIVPMSFSVACIVDRSARNTSA